jgi:hypothetical protein
MVPPLLGLTQEIKENPSCNAVPQRVVTLTLPDVPVETTAIMLVSLTTEKELAAVPPKLTAVAPIKFAPLIVTDVPWVPVIGVNDEIAGAILTIYAPDITLVAVPQLPVTTQ